MSWIVLYVTHLVHFGHSQETMSLLLSAAFAFVVLKEDTAVTEQAIKEDLKAIVATKIAKYAVPDHILVSDTSVL